MVEGLLEEAYAKGWQTLVHTNGDAAIDQLIRTARAAQQAAGVDDPATRRFVLIRGRYIREDQLDSIADQGLIASLLQVGR